MGFHYTQGELKSISYMYNHGFTAPEIAREMGRTAVAINMVIYKHRQNLKINYRCPKWTSEQERILIKCAQLDSSNSVIVTPRLIELCGHERRPIYRKIFALRKQGELPPVTGANDRWKEIGRQQNKWVFAKI